MGSRLTKYKTCGGCEKTLLRARHFHPTHAQCKECMREYQRKWRKQHTKGSKTRTYSGAWSQDGEQMRGRRRQPPLLDVDRIIADIFTE